MTSNEHGQQAAIEQLEKARQAAKDVAKSMAAAIGDENAEYATDLALNLTDIIQERVGALDGFTPFQQFYIGVLCINVLCASFNEVMARKMGG